MTKRHSPFGSAATWPHSYSSSGSYFVPTYASFRVTMATAFPSRAFEQLPHKRLPSLHSRRRLRCSTANQCSSAEKQQIARNHLVANSLVHVPATPRQTASDPNPLQVSHSTPARLAYLFISIALRRRSALPQPPTESPHTSGCSRCSGRDCCLTRRECRLPTDQDSLRAAT